MPPSPRFSYVVASAIDRPVDANAGIESFSRCHEGIQAESAIRIGRHCEKRRTYAGGRIGQVAGVSTTANSVFASTLPALIRTPSNGATW